MDRYLLEAGFPKSIVGMGPEAFKDRFSVFSKSMSLKSVKEAVARASVLCVISGFPTQAQLYLFSVFSSLCHDKGKTCRLAKLGDLVREVFEEERKPLNQDLIGVRVGSEPNHSYNEDLLINCLERHMDGSSVFFIMDQEEEEVLSRYPRFSSLLRSSSVTHISVREK